MGQRVGRLGLLLVLACSLVVSASPAFDRASQATQAQEAGDLETCAQLWAETARLFTQEENPNAAGRAWFYSAVAHLEMKDKDTALEVLEQALESFEFAENSSGLALVNFQMGVVLFELQRFDLAETSLQEAIVHSQKAEDLNRLIEAKDSLRKVLEAQLRWPEATKVTLELLEAYRGLHPEKVPDALTNLGALQQVQNRNQQARRYYLEAITALEDQERFDDANLRRERLARFLKQSRAHEEALEQYRMLLARTSEREQTLGFVLGASQCLLALERFQEVLDLLSSYHVEAETPYYRELVVVKARALADCDRKDEALALLTNPDFGNDYQRGLAFIELGRTDLAETSLRLALERASIEDKFTHTNELAWRLMLWNQLDAAAELLDQAFTKLPNLSAKQQSILRLNLGEIFLKRGQPQQAIPHFQDSLQGFKTEDAALEKATALNNLGAAYMYLGRFQEAIETLREAEDALSQLNRPHVLNATINNGLGNAYLKLGQTENAADFFRRALAVHTSFNNPEGQVAVLMNLGSCAELLKQPEQAEALYEQALNLALEARFPALAATASNNLGTLTSDGKQALLLYQQALELNPHNELFSGIVLSNMASANLNLLGNVDLGRRQAEAALEILADLGALDNETRLIRHLLKAALLEKNWGEARRLANLLLAKCEAQIAGLPSTSARSLLAQHESIIRSAIGQGLQNDLAQSFAWEELLRSLGLAVLTSEVSPSSAHLPPSLSQKRNSLLEGIKVLLASPPSRESRLLLADLNREYRMVLDQIEAHHLAAGRLHPQKAVQLREVQENLSHTEALVMYLKVDEQLHLLLVRPESISHRVIGPISEVDEAASLVLGSFRNENPQVDTDAEVERLTSLIWKPLADQLDGVDKVIVVPAGPLFALPFAGLSYGGTPLAESFSFSSAPSASAWLVSRKSKPRGQSALLGALGNFAPNQSQGLPMHGGQRLGALPLPGTLAEVAAIAPLFSDSEVLAEEELKSATLNSESQNKKILHFATHGVLNQDEPLLSGLVASDGLITAADIFGWQLDAELAVLSACHSGERADGEDYISLSSAFTFAGARTLLVSKWAIDDEATSQWMQLFYRELQAGKTANEALRTANLTLRETHPHPFYWAPFTLWGDGELRL